MVGRERDTERDRKRKMERGGKGWEEEMRVL